MARIKKMSLRSQDPYLDREKKRYPNPLPSREWLVEVLTRAEVPLKTEALAEQLSITPEEFEFFTHRLSAMVRDGQIYINRRGAVCVADKIELVKCRVEGHKDGYGFAIPLDATEKGDFALREKQMRALMHGDIITIRPTGLDKRGRKEGRVLNIIEHGQNMLIARAYWEQGVAIAIPEDKRITHTMLLPECQTEDFSSGQVVNILLTSFPTEHRPGIAKIQEVLGDYADSGMEIEIALRKHHLPYVFSPNCLDAIKSVPDHVLPSDIKNREDIRHLPLVTIDGETARDFDDAVFAEKQGRNYRLVVAIADVSHYVLHEKAIDKDAIERGTSVYFPRRVIPMLPEKLSNGICSLNPDVDRLCMVCDMTITYRGNIKEYRFYPAVMNSKARLTYNGVWDLITSGENHALKKEIDTLYALYHILNKKRKERGAMEFEGQETQMIFDDHGKILKIIPVVRNHVHRLIEECMLAANVCAADFLSQHKHPALYRSHAKPNIERLTILREQLALLGLSLSGGDTPTPKDFALLVESIQDRDDKHMIEIMLLRSMQQAVYQTENEGHFGLAYDAYTHFTSPIRRYPDLFVHRCIKEILQGKQYKINNLQALGAHCSFTERRADEASKDVERWLKTYYAKDKMGEVFDATVTGMTSFGLFVTLNTIYLEGMIHISDLGQDYFHYRPEILSIEGEHTRLRFRLGDPLVVRIAQADLDTCRIDLTLISGGNQVKASETQSKNKTSRNKTPQYSTQKKPRVEKKNTNPKQNVRNTRKKRPRKKPNAKTPSI